MALFWVLQDFSMDKFLSTLSGSDFRFLFVLSASIIFEQFLRSYKWSLILIPFCKANLRLLFGSIMVGYLSNYLAPFRVSPFVRGFLIAKFQKIKISTAFASIGIDRLTMIMTNSNSIQDVLFFPQMKPEKKGPELGENEKLIFDIIKKESKMELGDLKSQVDLSNKKWDKAIKGLATHGLTKVNKTDDGLFIELIR